MLWVLGFLILLNLSILISYFLITMDSKTESLPASESRPGRALKSELELTPQQDAEVRRINSSYKVQSMPILDSIKTAKSRLLEELSGDNPDKEHITSILESLGIHQKNLQKANVQQFLELKKVCNPEQAARLSEIYAELYGCELKGRGQGEGKGMRMRHRHGQQKENN